jgi:two-component system, chemotaxis family, chemotaxis protein CheY
MGGFRALIVDDSPTLRHGLIHALGGIRGLTCTEAADGAEGIRRLADAHFDLVITDLQMPVLNGFAFIQYLRHRPETQAIPILVVAATNADADRKKLEQIGVTDFLQKPFDASQVLAAARKLLPQAEAARGV